VLLASAYANTSLLTDPRKSAEENLPRVVALLREAIAVEEKLVAMQPDAPKYQLMLAQGQFILASAICDNGDCATVADLFRQASPALVAYADGGRNSNGYIVSLSNDSGLAWALYKSGQEAEAESRLLAIDKELTGISRTQDNLELTFALSQTQCRLGRIYAARSASLKAQSLLTTGVAGFKKGDAASPFDSIVRSNLDDCVAALDLVLAENARHD
jgi:hypothetical protein